MAFHAPSSPRTMVDLAAVVPPSTLRRALEQAVFLRLFDGRAVEAALERSRGRCGTGVLRRLVAELEDEPPLVRRELERRFLDLVDAARLPRPVVNGRVGDYEVDFHWPARRLVVETDGREAHGHAVAFERDRRRDVDLQIAGWRVLRFTWRQVVEEPRGVKAALSAMLAYEATRTFTVRRR